MSRARRAGCWYGSWRLLDNLNISRCIWCGRPFSARRGVIRRPEGRFEHFCTVCGAWGAFGFGVTAERPGRWFCFDHRPLSDDLAANLGENP